MDAKKFIRKLIRKLYTYQFNKYIYDIMLTIKDIYYKILKLVDIDDYKNLCSIDKSNSEFIKNTKHYKMFLKFHLDLKLKINLLVKGIRKPYSLNPSTIQVHKYALALEYNCKKLIDKYRIINSTYLTTHKKRFLLQSAAKSNSLQLFNKIMEECSIDFSIFTLCNDFSMFYKYELNNIINYYLPPTQNYDNQWIKLGFGFEGYFIIYIYKTKTYCNYNPNVIIMHFNKYFDTSYLPYKPNTIYVLDIITKITINLKLNFDIKTKIKKLLPTDYKKFNDKLNRYLLRYAPKIIRN